MEVNFNFFRKEDEPKFKIELDSSYPESDFSRLLIPNGLAMTYSIARGIVGQATCTSLHDKSILPLINFVELMKDGAQREKQNQKKKLLKSRKFCLSHKRCLRDETT